MYVLQQAVPRLNLLCAWLCMHHITESSQNTTSCPWDADLSICNKTPSAVSKWCAHWRYVLPDVCYNVCCLDDEQTLMWTCEVTSMVSDVIQHVGWSNAIFIYDHRSFPCLQILVNTLSQLYVGIVHVPLTLEGMERGSVNLTDVFQALSTSFFMTTGVRHVMLCVSPNLVDDVLEKAATLRILSGRYQWFIICPVQSPWSNLIENLAQDSNVLYLHYLEPEGNSYFQHPFGALNSSQQFNDSSQSVAKLYTFTSNPDEHFSPVATWQAEQGWMDPLAEPLYTNTFRNFGGRLLIIGTIVATPFVKRLIEGNETIYDGFCIELLRTLASQLNFRYKIVESPDNKYGAPDKNGTWNGMVGMVARKEVDMGVGPYTITSIRETVVDFSVPFMVDGGGILTKKANSSATLMAGLGAFTYGIWLSLVALTVVVGILLYLLVHYSPCRGAGAEELKSPHWRLASCIMHISGSLLQQGSEHHPRNISGRCMLGFWWVFSILIISTYTASLTSVLTVDREGSKIDSIDDLAKSSLEPFVLTGSVWDTLFKNAKTGIYEKLGKRMKGMPVVTSENEALGLLMQGGRAFIHDVNSVSYMYVTHCKQLHLAASRFNSNGFGIILQQNAPYKAAVDNIILRLQQGGFLDNWRSHWWPVTSECEQQASSLSQPNRLGVTRFTGLLLIYGSVIAAAILCFMLRLCLNRIDDLSRMASHCRKSLDKTESAEVDIPPGDGDFLWY